MAAISAVPCQCKNVKFITEAVQYVEKLIIWLFSPVKYWIETESAKQFLLLYVVKFSDSFY